MNWDLTAAVLGVPGHTTEVGLASGGVELAVAGYSRCTAGGWKIVGDAAYVTVQFGPFPVGAEFDTVDLYADGELAATVEVGVTVLGPGALWAETVTYG